MYANYIIANSTAGGALKPANVGALWVHVTCAWFQPKVSFASEETMEPAVGILNIAPLSFAKVKNLLKIFKFFDSKFLEFSY